MSYESGILFRLFYRQCNVVRGIMSKQFTFKKLLFLMLSSGACIASPYVNAAAFQLFEQDGASVGNYHAGRAAIAEDASTAFYNPAGLVRIKNQQLVLGLDPIITDIEFHGTVDVNTVGLGTVGPMPAAAQAGGLNFVPSLNYAAPIVTDWLVFGFSIVAPFGVKTDYGTNSFARYAATLTSLQVIDFVPSLGVAFNDKFSMGVGIDIERSSAEFDLVAGNSLINAILGSNADTYGQNTGGDHAYGYHVGALYQFTPNTRAGLAYASRVTHVIHGTSQFFGPLANDSLGGTQINQHLRAQIPLPATSTFSIFHTINPSWDIMGSLIYTQWNSLQQLILTGVSAIVDGNSSNNVTITIPQHFKNTWNYSVGANYHMNDQWMLRTGLGFDQTPSNAKDRNLQMPDSDRIAAALGLHFQPIKALGIDVAWTHIFAMNTRINNNTLVVGDQSSTVQGSIHAAGDVYGLQLKWDIV